MTREDQQCEGISQEGVLSKEDVLEGIWSDLVEYRLQLGTSFIYWPVS
jgi:hypothetical protein